MSKDSTANKPEKNCCCSCQCGQQEENNKPWPSYVIGETNATAGKIYTIKSEWSWKDRVGQVLARTSNSFRMNYAIDPGVYALGKPGAGSPVFVSANYKLSFDILRKSLADISAWILVLDTKGINVWCAAGKGTFGTEELIQKIQACKVHDLVSHKKIILPQLGAPGVASGEVQKKTGFRVLFGPVRACDIPAYMKENYTASEKMRTVVFPLKDRLTLVPMEINLASKKVALLILLLALINAVQPGGLNITKTFYSGLPLFISAIAALLTGSFLTQALLPFVPFRSFALKGWLIGLLVQAGLIMTGGVFAAMNMLLLIASLLFFPLLSSYIALQFTGSATYTSMAGVKKELKYSIPVYVAGSVIALVLLGFHTFMLWRIS